MNTTTIKSRIEKLEQELKRLKTIEQGDLPKPDFENDYFFVENGTLSVKFRPREQRRYIIKVGDTVKVCTAKCYNFKMRPENAEEIRKAFNDAMDFYVKEVK